MYNELDYRPSSCRKRRDRRSGTTLLEFVLVGIPLLFLGISITEMARGMWQYHTLQFATKQAAAYASVHGATCDT